MAGGGQRKIDLGIAAFAFNLISALVLIGVAWGGFKGGNEAQLQALQKQVDRLEARVDRMTGPDRREPR